MRYRFGSFELDTSALQLRVDGRTVALEPQVFNLLVFLVENRDRVVTKDELFETVWQGRIVSDATLSSRIKAVRQALGDDGERQALIRTLRGRGFQFVGHVDIEVDEAEKPVSSPPKRRVWKWASAVAGFGFLVTVIAHAVWQPWSRPTENTIAAMAFADMSESQDQAYFADGVAEDILNALMKMDGLRVVGRTSSFSFRGKDADLKTIGKRLGVANVLEGSVRRDGDRLRITAQLVQVADGYHLWSGSYDRTITDVFDVQDDIARSVAGALQKVFNPGGEAPSHGVADEDTDPETYQLYLQGRWLLRNRNFERLSRAIGTFKQVIARQPGHALAYAGLATAEVLHPTYNRRRQPTDEIEARKRAEVWAQKALQLDPSLSEPHAALALSYGREWQWARSRQLLEKALHANPNDTTARVWYGTLLYVTGRVEDAIEQLDLAIARDPVYPILVRVRAAVLYTLGREPEAREAAKLSIALGNASSYLILGHIARHNGDIDQAIELYMSYWKHDNTSTERIEARRRWYEKLYSPNVDRVALVRDVERNVADGRLSKVRAMFLYQDAGDVERALKLYAERVTWSRSFLSKVWWPEHKAMRQHPYFPTFVKRLGLLAYWKAFGFPDRCQPADDDGIACD